MLLSPATSFARRASCPEPSRHVVMDILFDGRAPSENLMEALLDRLEWFDHPERSGRARAWDR